ncbi:MAG: SDR family oxidoreductase [Burkholderiales bacterium]|nr:SDR family oxidoreductase [Burkholderiales bacterium]
MKEFENKVAVITGGASGLGRAFADKAVALKMKLVLGDIREAPLQQAVTELKAAGAEVVALAGDVSKAEYIEALATLATNSFGPVHCLFNNAGVGSGGLIWENTVKDWEWVLNVNLWGVIHGVRTFTPLMLAAAKNDPGYEGHIVSVSSIAGLIAPGLMGTYNVSKHAVVAHSESLYHDLAKVQPRIAASVLCPGFTPTGISKSHVSRPAEMQNAERPTDSMIKAQDMVAKAVSSGRLTAVDVANITFDAIRDKQFYILSHPNFMKLVKVRLEDIAELRNPRDVFSLKD